MAEGDAQTVIWVPGSWEIPLAARRVAKKGGFDAIICVGAVIKGGTAHFDYVAGEAAKGVSHASLETGVPVMFGVVTTDTVEQAIRIRTGESGDDAL